MRPSFVLEDSKYVDSDMNVETLHAEFLSLAGTWQAVLGPQSEPEQQFSMRYPTSAFMAV
jgi:hypothetical protein